MAEAETVRVVLLARAGEARDRLGAALADAGAELVLSADPLSADPRQVAQARPGAVVIALEPAIEDALERFEAVLSDPSVTVLFEEAELATRRAGWDAARWVRHLGAKLRRHDDVLPPGREDERAWQPTPGPLPARRDPDLDLDSVAGEARTRAGDVPRDDGLVATPTPLDAGDDLDLDAELIDSIPASAPPRLDDASGASDTIASTPLALTDDLDADLLDSVDGDAPPRLDDAPGAGNHAASTALDAGDDLDLELLDSIPGGPSPRADALPEGDAAPSAALELGDDIDFELLDAVAGDARPRPADVPRDDADTSSASLAFADDLDLELLDSVAGAGPDAGDAAHDETRDAPFAGLAFTDDLDSAVFDEHAHADGDALLPAASAAFEPMALVDADALFAALSGPSADRDDDRAEAEAAPAVGVERPAAPDWTASTLSLADDDDAAPASAADTRPERSWSDGGLTLVDDDAPLSAPAQADAAAPRHAPALDALTERASALSLADADSYGHGPQRGAVLVEAGLGGPDAVRQLLAALPESFPRPVLVRLQLDGGRYDRLVTQMARVAAMPVALAEAGQAAAAGTIYFLPAQLTLESRQSQLWFAEGGAGDLLAALPEADSAHLFLSGSQPALVDAALAHMASGRGLIAAQSPDTCYDGAAATALIERGADAAAPSELAARLTERWPS